MNLSDTLVNLTQEQRHEALIDKINNQTESVYCICSICGEDAFVVEGEGWMCMFCGTYDID